MGRGLRQEHRSLGRGCSSQEVRWGRQRCLLKGCVCLVVDWKKEEEFITHSCQFQAAFKVIPLAQVEDSLSDKSQHPCRRHIHCFRPKVTWQQMKNARYKHLCYQWSGPRTRRWWRRSSESLSNFWVALWFAFWNIFLICHQGFIEPRIEPYSEHCLSILQVMQLIQT